FLPPVPLTRNNYLQQSPPYVYFFDPAQQLMSDPSEDYITRALEATRQLDNLKAQRLFAEAAEKLDNEPDHPEFEHNLIHSIDLAGKIFGANSVESALRLDQLGLYYFKV